MGNDVNANSLIRELLMSYSSRVINRHVAARLTTITNCQNIKNKAGKKIIIKHLKTTCFKYEKMDKMTSVLLLHTCW